MTLEQIEPTRIKEILHLHVQDPKIDHPEVFTTFCLDRDFVADRHAAGNDKPLILLLQLILRREDGSWLEERMLIPDLMKSPGRFLPFPKPGKWEVNAYVVELEDPTRGKYSVFRFFRDRFLRRNPGMEGGWHYQLSLSHGYSGESDFWRTASQVKRITEEYTDTNYKGFGDLEIVMPKDAFAPPPPAWLDAWVRAYTPRSKPVDECDFRRRFIASLFIQPIPYLLWESAKRSLALIVGLWTIVLSGYVKNGGYMVKRALSPQLVFTFPDFNREESSIYKSWHPRLRPLPLVGYGLIAWFLWSIRDGLIRLGSEFWNFLTSPKMPGVSFDLGGLFLIIATIIGVLGGTFLLASFILKKTAAYLERTRPARKAAEAKREEEFRKKQIEIEKQEREKREAEAHVIRSGGSDLLAVCGPEGVPAEQGKKVLRKSITLQISALKRKVCREYA